MKRARCLRQGLPTAALTAGLVAVAVTLLSLRHLPLQDFPAHAFLVELDRHVGPSNELYERPEPRIWGYSLVYLATRAWLSFLSPEAALEVIVLLSAVLLPLSAASLARAAGSHGSWAGVLALPLALSWPLKIGFIPYNAGLVLALFALSAALRLQREPSATHLLAYAGGLLAAYLAHPVAFCIAALGVLFAILTERSARQLLILGGPALPALVAFARDLWLEGFAPMPGTEGTLPPAPLSFRSLPEGFISIFTRGFSMEDPVSAAVQTPLAVFVIWGVASVASGSGVSGFSNRIIRYLIALGLALTVGTLIIPDSLGLALLLATRLPQAGWLMFGIVAAVWISRGGRATQLAVVAAVALSLGSAAADLAREAETVTAVVGAQPQRRLSGKFVTTVLPTCESRGRSPFGTYEPLRHIVDMWLTVDAATPYVFAWNRYHPIWYRPDVYRRELRGPVEWVTNADEVRLPPEQCARLRIERLEGAMSWPGFDGVLAAGPPAILEAAVKTLGASPTARLAPGVYLLPSAESDEAPFGAP